MRDRAFTLLELVLVLSIIGVLSAIAVPKFQRSLAKQRADAAANRIAADLRYARKLAMQQSSRQGVIFARSPGHDSYGMAGVSGLENPASAYRVSLSDEPYNASFLSVSFGGTLTISFDGYGVPDNGGSVVVQAGEFTRTVSVDAVTGEVVISP